MAIKDNLEQKVEKARQAGYSDEQITNFLKTEGITSPLPPVQKTPPSGIVATIKDIPSDIVEGVKGAGETIVKGFETGKEAIAQVKSGEVSPVAGITKTVGAIGRGVAGLEGEGLLTLAKLFISPATEQKVGETVAPIAKEVIESAPVKALIARYESATPEGKAMIDGILGTAEGLTTTLGLGAVRKILGKAVEVGGEAVQSVKSLFKKTPISIEDVAGQADIALGLTPKINITKTSQTIDDLVAQGKTAEARALAESTAPNITNKEKLAGLRPDIKARIQGKTELMKEYIDVTNTRNLTDTAPTVSEHAGNYVRKATDEMQTILNETGSTIGESRKKLATYKAPIDDVVSIENSFKNQLAKLNLEIKNGVVKQKSNALSVVGSEGDIGALQRIYENLLKVKESPTLTNLIDFRASLTNKVNFEKTAREVSSSVDTFARQVQKDVAKTAETVVGKSNVVDIRRYSDFMDAFNDIKSFTDRAAGGEYLIRLVLSGRGGEARKIIATIKEYTGIDLMDHATILQVATEMIANPAQKNLFRQEITKAGLDAVRLLKGDPSGVAGTIFEYTMDKILNPEKILMQATKI